MIRSTSDQEAFLWQLQPPSVRASRPSMTGPQSLFSCQSGLANEPTSLQDVSGLPSLVPGVGESASCSAPRFCSRLCAPWPMLCNARLAEGTPCLILPGERIVLGQVKHRCNHGRR